MFSRDGYRAVGIDALLKQAGVAKMTLYKHFRSKEELIAVVLDQRSAAIAAAIAARVKAVPAEDPQAPRLRLLAVFAWLQDWLQDPGFEGCLFIKAAGEYADEDELPRQAALRFKDACRKLLEELCGGLDCGDPIGLARQLELLMEGAAVVGFMRRDPTAAVAASEGAALLIDAAERAPASTL
ncbi:TetR/AcrR family transcriptional regulator [Synechococcus sp. RSCCF101]|nr:TetR/AcrR family transcriptional regulator [Synechococcus sp. RSCCF101]